jgi:hypothetical protein
VILAFIYETSGDCVVSHGFSQRHDPGTSGHFKAPIVIAETFPSEVFFKEKLLVKKPGTFMELNHPTK